MQRGHAFTVGAPIPPVPTMQRKKSLAALFSFFG
jgi:hypothetical protein